MTRGTRIPKQVRDDKRGVGAAGRLYILRAQAALIACTPTATLRELITLDRCEAFW